MSPGVGRAALPVDEVLAQLVCEAGRGGFVLTAPPGAGKTTRVPPALLDAVPGRIVVVQPRRVAARAAAARIAWERGEPVGKGVGYQVRYERVGGPSTRIWVVTDGILLRMLQSDPLLDGVGAVLVDEVHERGLEQDLGLALLREVREARPELCVGAMSATVDPGPFAAHLGGVAVIGCPGRTWPVDVGYLGLPDPRPVEDVVADGVRRAIERHDGDALVFLPGVREIRRVGERLADLAARGIDVVPLYGDLPPDAQDRALLAGDRRRVVLATNVAETSVTVPGVRIVVDSGLARRPRRDPATGLDHLDTVRISRASADQRAGRAGRTGPGVVARLWTERDHRDRDAYDPPEVMRVDLCGPVLQILAWGGDPRRFGWIEAPPERAVDAAVSVLGELGAIDASGLTALGRDLAALPLHPRLARLAVEGARLGHPADAALAAALLAERDEGAGGAPVTPTSPTTSSDVLERVDAVRARKGDAAVRHRVIRAAEQLEGLVTRQAGRGRGRSADRDEALLRGVLAAWPDRVARRREAGSDRARMVGGRGVRLDPHSSAVRDAELFVAVSVTADGPDARVRIASAIDEGWLDTEQVTVVAFDPATDSVRGRRVARYRDLELGAHPAPIDPVAAAACVEEVAAARIAAGRVDEVAPKDGGFAALRERIAAMARWDPDGAWALDLTALLPSVCAGQRSLAGVRAADWVGAARDALGWQRWSELERRAPVRVSVPSGRAHPLDYAADPPGLSVKIQEMFGATTTPTVDDGRVRVRLHLLAPNGRPQQITDDLAGFWDRTWREVRGELRARYPKHAWPEDPRRAAPEVRPRRRVE